MRGRAHDLTERASALSLLAVSVVLAIWSRDRIAAVDAETARREERLEDLVEWQRAGVDRSGGRRTFDPRALADFAGAELVVAHGAGVDYLLLQPPSAPGRTQ